LRKRWEKRGKAAHGALHFTNGSIPACRALWPGSGKPTRRAKEAERQIGILMEHFHPIYEAHH
jgi:hypothetical protein